MSLRREVSLGVGLAVVALVHGLYMGALPTLADARVAPPQDRDLANTERTTAWTATAVVAAISLLAKDPAVFILGGGMIIAESWLHRHANHFDPTVGLAVMPASRLTMHEPDVTAGFSPAA